MNACLLVIMSNVQLDLYLPLSLFTLNFFRCIFIFYSVVLFCGYVLVVLAMCTFYYVWKYIKTLGKRFVTKKEDICSFKSTGIVFLGG